MKRVRISNLSPLIFRLSYGPAVLTSINNILLYIFSISTSRVDLTKVGGLAQPWLRFRGRSIAKSGNLRSCSNSSRTVPSNGRFLPEADHGQTKNTGRSRLISWSMYTFHTGRFDSKFSHIFKTNLPPDPYFIVTLISMTNFWSTKYFL